MSHALKAASSETLKEILLLLSSQKLPATPLNFRWAYEKVSGHADLELCERRELADILSFNSTPARSIAGSDPLLDALQTLIAEAQLSKELINGLIKSSFTALLNQSPELKNTLDQLQAALANGEALATLAPALSLAAAQCAEASQSDQQILLGMRRLLECVALNVEALAEDGKSVEGQVATLRQISAPGPLTLNSLKDAERVLTELAATQSTLKDSLAQSRRQIKELIREFVAQMDSDAGALGEQSQKMEDLTEIALSNDDLPQIKIALTSLAKEARLAASKTRETHESLAQKETKIAQAQQQIDSLQKQLAEVSQKVKEDALTGALNRRGLEEIALRELSGAQRGQQSLCLAILDIDDFKIFNDQLGHTSGDQALQYLVTTLKNVLRPSDTISRFGGEEFVLLLPHSSIEHAKKVIIRVQRALTKDFWMQNDQRLLTFSSGVTAWRASDTLTEMITRADRLLYAAKNSGKNKVMSDLCSPSEEESR